ncbi:hypothetical protein HEK616_36230 [Streptomyces nigrescens]|uniref:Uncharacterized protein n=1 Tax=Streptomyces nigrescens TaxID=1920 RepID=A0ABM7ZUW1_STRNI|nr:hypothetical protein HEK616_36230 [Streptomyces nigrescens]
MITEGLISPLVRMGGGPVPSLTDLYATEQGDHPLKHADHTVTLRLERRDRRKSGSVFTATASPPPLAAVSCKMSQAPCSPTPGIPGTWETATPGTRRSHSRSDRNSQLPDCPDCPDALIPAGR